MTHNQQDATKIIHKEMRNTIERASYASLKGKIYPDECVKLPPYVDDYKGISEEERKVIWGLSN